MNASANTMLVQPRSGRLEAAFLVAAIAVILGIGYVLVQARQVDNYEPRLFGWQISSFYDLNPTDQAVYTALVPASEELWWIHGGLIEFPEPGRTDTWPTVEDLEGMYELAPFVKDVSWEQNGHVKWQRIASAEVEGATVYFGSGGDVPGQSAYLLVLMHQHKGASYAEGESMWVHKDPNVAPPPIMKTDSLIVNGWHEIIPYNGADEVKRIKGR